MKKKKKKRKRKKRRKVWTTEVTDSRYNFQMTLLSVFLSIFTDCANKEEESRVKSVTHTCVHERYERHALCSAQLFTPETTPVGLRAFYQSAQCSALPAVGYLSPRWLLKQRDSSRSGRELLSPPSFSGVSSAQGVVLSAASGDKRSKVCRCIGNL